MYFPSAGPGSADDLDAPPVPLIGAVRGTVLVVEDDDRVRRFTRGTLQKLGCTVLDAPSGEEALRLCETPGLTIDLLVTDVVMSGLSGRELAEAVARTRPGIKVLYVSGCTDDAVLRHRVRSTQVRFLQKPFTADTLAEKVRAALG